MRLDTSETPPRTFRRPFAKEWSGGGLDTSETPPRHFLGVTRRQAGREGVCVQADEVQEHRAHHRGEEEESAGERVVRQRGDQRAALRPTCTTPPEYRTQCGFNPVGGAVANVGAHERNTPT